MISKKIRIGLIGFAAVALLAAPTSAFAGDGDEGMPAGWTYNPGTPAGWTYNPGTQDHPTKTGPTLGQPQQVDQTLELAMGKPIKLNPCILSKTCQPGVRRRLTSVSLRLQTVP